MASAYGEPFLLNEQSKINLAPHTFYLVDNAQLGIADIIAQTDTLNWQQNGKYALNFGYDQPPYWLKLNISNQYVSEQARLLEFRHPSLDYVSLYIVNSKGVVIEQLVGGDQLPPKEKYIQHPNIIFPLKLPPNEATNIYIRIQTNGTLQLPLALWRWQAFNEHTLVTYILQGIFYGMVLIMLIYNLMIWVVDKQSVNLKYTAYILSFTIYMSCENGIGYLYIWPSYTWLNNTLPIIASGLSLASLNYFISDLFNAKKYYKKIHLYLKCSFISYLLITAFCLFLTGWVAAYIQAAMLMATIVMVITITIYMLKIKHPDCNYFAMAWVFMIIGCVLYLASILGFIPATTATQYGIQFGACIEIMFLSLAMADRMVRLQKEKNIAFQNAIKLSGQIQIEQDRTFNSELKNLELEKQYSHTLELQVKEQTDELHQTLGELSKAHETLKTISVTDALTQLNNRYYFNEYWPIEYTRACRDKTPLSIVILDIDHFKKVNDTYGHPAGDQCLISVANSIKHNVARAPDIVCRYGGEEFVLILPGTDEQGAILVAEKIRKKISDLEVVWQGNNIKLSASLGVSSLSPKSRQNTNNQLMINQADQALYQAKNKGRNQVVVFDYGLN
jgi:diguanylate cyclase (GGDEF)-like protein